MDVYVCQRLSSGNVTDSLEPTAADIRSRWPGWITYYGTPDQLCHARLVVNVRGDTWQDVSDEIRTALAKLTTDAYRRRDLS